MPLTVTPEAARVLAEALGNGAVRLYIDEGPDGWVYGLFPLDATTDDDVLLWDGGVRIVAEARQAPVFESAHVEAPGGQLAIRVPEEQKWMSCGSACTGFGKDDCGGAGPCGGKGCHVGRTAELPGTPS